MRQCAHHCSQAISKKWCLCFNVQISGKEIFILIKYHKGGNVFQRLFLGTANVLSHKSHGLMEAILKLKPWDRMKKLFENVCKLC